MKVMGLHLIILVTRGLFSLFDLYQINYILLVTTILLHLNTCPQVTHDLNIGGSRGGGGGGAFQAHAPPFGLDVCVPAT